MCKGGPLQDVRCWQRRRKLLLHGDAEARGVGCGNQVDYAQIVNMVFDADSVVNW
jgi:hypothetical protein